MSLNLLKYGSNMLLNKTLSSLTGLEGAATTQILISSGEGHTFNIGSANCKLSDVGLYLEGAESSPEALQGCRVLWVDLYEGFDDQDPFPYSGHGSLAGFLDGTDKEWELLFSWGRKSLED